MRFFDTACRNRQICCAVICFNNRNIFLVRIVLSVCNFKIRVWSLSTTNLPQNAIIAEISANLQCLAGDICSHSSFFTSPENDICSILSDIPVFYFDSVFQIAAHEEIVPPEKLYEYCRIARKILQLSSELRI